MRKKKLLLTAMSLVMCLGATAQRYALITLDKAQPTQELKLGKRLQPQKVDLAPNQRLMGFYTTDDWSGAGQGVGFGKTMNLRLGAKIPSEIINAFVGGKIVGLRYAMSVAENVSKVFVQKDGQTTDAVSKTLTGACQVGWNTVMFDTPWSIEDNTILYLGYDATLTAGKYSISVTNRKNPHQGGLMAYGDLGQQGTAWYFLTNNKGNLMGDLCVQAIVELDNLAPQDLQLSNLMPGTSYATSGKEVPFTVVVRQNGTETADSYELGVYFDGNKVGTINSAEALKGNTEKTVNSKFTVPEGTADGEHTIKVKVEKVNGEAPADNLEDDEVEASIKIFAQTMDRQKMLIEHYTSQRCTACYLGDEFLEKLNESRGDLAWASIHGNMQGKDPMNFPKGENILSYGHLQAFPSASFNRNYIQDFASDFASQGGSDQTIIYSIGYKKEYIDQVVELYNNNYLNDMMKQPAFSNITLKPTYNKKSRTIGVDVNLAGVDNVASLLDGYGLYVYVTEDSVVDRQYKNGVWTNKYTHNHVLRDVLTSEYGDKIEWNGAEYNVHFDYTVPETYPMDLNKNHTPKVNKMHVIAFVAPIAKKNGNDYKKMAVDNCEIADMTNATGINDVNAEQAESEIVGIYTITGQRIAEPQQGVNIIVYSNGKAEKVLVNE